MQFCLLIFFHFVLFFKSVFDCETKKGDFDNVEWYILNPKKKRSNFYIGMSGTLVFDKEVFDSEIFPLFEMAGEILELKMWKVTILLF